MSETNEQFLSREITFFKDLSEDEKQLLLSGTYDRQFAKGEIVSSSGAPCLGVVIVKSGKLRVFMLSEEGREITLYYVEPSEICILSASCVLSNISFEVQVEAELESEVIQISSSVFGKISKNNVYVENYALKLAVERFSDVMWAMQQLLFFSMDKRLAMYLYDEVAKIKSLEINQTHEQIAKSLGSAREVITRLLQRFSQDGLVELSRGKIVVLDKKAISRLFD